MFKDQHYKKNRQPQLVLMLLACLLFIFSGVVGPVLAEDHTPNTPSAAQNTQSADSKQKNEVVYAKLNDTGGVSEVYIVNRFKPLGDTPLKDYGTYSETKPLTDNGSLTQKDDHLLIKTGNSDFYYQGKPKSNTLPWRFAIGYFLDGKKVEPAALSGATGQLEIHIEVAANPQMSDEKNGVNPWAQNDLLQLSLTMPGDACKDLAVEGGNIAQAGSNQLATFMFFPNSKPTTYKIKADINDFYMPAMQIAGVPLNMNLSVDDFLAISDDKDLQALQAGIAQLHEGSSALSVGLFELKKGGDDLQKGLGELTEGGNKLAEGSDRLAEGFNQYLNGVDELAKGIDQTYQGSEALAKATDDFAAGFALLDGRPLVENSKLIKDSLAQIATGLEGLGNAEDITALKQQLSDLETAATRLSAASSAFQQGIDELSAGLTALTAASDGLVNGMGGVISDMQSQPDAPTSPDIIQHEAGLSANATENADVQLLLNYTVAQNQKQNTDKARYLQNLSALYDGANALNSNLSTLSQNVTTLQANYTAFNENIQHLATMLPTLAQMADLVDLAAGMQSLSENYSSFDDGLNQYVGGVTAMQEAFKSTQGKPDLYTGILGLRDGLKEINNGTRQLSAKTPELKKGLKEFVGGVKKFTDGVGQLEKGFAQYLGGVGQAADGSAQLADGLGELYKGVSNIDEQLKEKIDTLMEQYRFDDQQTVSFASERNRNVGQVQFVIMTEAVPEKEAPKTTTEQPETNGLWERLIHLFQ